MSRIFSVNIGSGGGGGGGGPGGALTGRAGVESLTAAQQTVVVLFSATMGTTNYSLDYSIQNNTDAFPIMLQGVVTAKDALGFTVVLNAPTDTANYTLNYQAVGYV